MKTEILNVPFDVVTRREALNIALDLLQQEKNHMIFTPNPEIVMEANEDAKFMEILKCADLLIPDGIGIVIASKLNKVKLKERVAGCDLVFSLLKKIKDTDHTVYILGGKESIAKIAKKNMETKYKGLKIVGTHNGYFDSNEEKEIIKEIERLKPSILLVGMSAPKQEKWIYKYKDELSVRLSIGVGGSIDVMAGSVKRAPVIYQKLCLEWLYRAIKEPSRSKRLLRIPIFVMEVLKNRLRFK